MKKYLLLLVIPFTLFAETCEELKSQAISNITSSESLLSDNALYIQRTYQNITSLGSTLDTLDQRTSGDPYVNTARGQVLAILQGVQLVEQNENTISNDLFTTRSLLSSIDCSCDETATCPCDFSDIIQLLTSISSSTSDTYIELQTHGLYLSQINENLTDITLQLKGGFGNVTNLLQQVLGSISNPTSRIAQTIRTYTSYGYKTVQLAQSGDSFQESANAQSWRFGNLAGSTTYSIFDFLKVLTQNSYVSSTLANRLQWIHKDFRDLTNDVGRIHRDQTNYFSFFRGEIGVQGVLSDWQSEQVSGTYHDFLTNHYLTVVRGGSLSGNQSSKTNWFSRIETLLAALVFTDTTETNTVDSSVGESERSQISSAYMSANSAASSVSDDLKTTTQGIVELYRSYFETFDNAAMPSHVVLMRLNGTNGEEDVQISFSSDSLSILVEGCRIVTTLCWASVGIFLLYKFLVWSARCVIVACQFIYRAISSVFKS